MSLSGSISRLPSGRRLYAVGDIHGMAGLLEATFARIDADMAASPPEAATEIYLGDFVDRGPDSAGVIKLLMARSQVRDVVCIAGNHEIYLLESLKDAAALTRWLGIGGRETLMSYGISPAREADSAVTQAEWGRRFSPAERAFFGTMRLRHQIGRFLFVHAGIRPGVPLEDQTVDDLTLIRDEFLLAPRNDGLIVVHGHTPVAEVDIRSNRINLDTGAYLTGKLSCIAIEQERFRLV